MRILFFVIGLGLASVASAHPGADCETSLAATGFPTALDGSVPFPVDALLKFNLKIGAGPVTHTISFEVRRRADAYPPVRRIARRLSKLTRARTEFEHEWAAVYAEYEDGSTKAIKLRSKQFDRVTGDHHTIAYARSKIFDQGLRITRVIHVHTHSDPRNQVIDHNIRQVTPSPRDYRAWSSLRHQLRAVYPDVYFEAFVVPFGEYCDEIFFRVTSDDLDSFRETPRARQSLRKLRRFLASFSYKHK